MAVYESADKFACRNCGCRQSIVRTTQVIERMFRGKKMVIIKRRRVCRYCQIPYTTVEHQYEDKFNHEINPDAAVRPIYDIGRAVGRMELINGIMKPSEELTEPPALNPPTPKRAVARHHPKGSGPDTVYTLPPQKSTPRKKKSN